MAYVPTFYSSRVGERTLVGSYRGGLAYYHAQMVETGRILDGSIVERVMHLSVNSLNGTITGRDLLDISRNCRAALDNWGIGPRWIAAHGRAEQTVITVQGAPVEMGDYWPLDRIWDANAQEDNDADI